MDKVVIVTYKRCHGSEVYALEFPNIKAAMLGILALNADDVTDLKLYRAEEITW